MFRARIVAVGGRGLPWTIYPSREELQLDGCLGVEPREVGIGLTECIYDWGWEGHAPFELYPGICFITEEMHGKPHSE
jgi:hypothetical protein